MDELTWGRERRMDELTYGGEKGWVNMGGGNTERSRRREG